MKSIHELFSHMQWADASVWKAIDGVAPSEAPDLHQLLYHLHVVQLAFLQMFHEKKVDVPPHAGFAALSDIRKWAIGNYGELDSFVHNLDASQLDATRHLPWGKRIAESFEREFTEITLHDMLLQVPSHSTYHRGQVNMKIRTLGGTPPLVDYIAWAAIGKPPAQW